MNNENIELPPLPEAKYDLASRSNGYSDAKILNWDGYSDDQMTEYARLAVLQERERCGKICDRYSHDDYVVLVQALIRKGE